MEEKEVSPKYYLSNVYLDSLMRHKQRHESKGNGFGYEIKKLNKEQALALIDKLEGWEEKETLLLMKGLQILYL